MAALRSRSACWWPVCAATTASPAYPGPQPIPALPADDRRLLLFLIPLLRCRQSESQPPAAHPRIDCRCVTPGSAGGQKQHDIDLEQWRRTRRRAFFQCTTSHRGGEGERLMRHYAATDPLLLTAGRALNGPRGGTPPRFTTCAWPCAAEPLLRYCAVLPRGRGRRSAADLGLMARGAVRDCDIASNWRAALLPRGPVPGTREKRARTAPWWRNSPPTRKTGRDLLLEIRPGEPDFPRQWRTARVAGRNTTAKSREPAHERHAERAPPASALVQAYFARVRELLAPVRLRLNCIPYAGHQAPAIHPGAVRPSMDKASKSACRAPALQRCSAKSTTAPRRAPHRAIIPTSAERRRVQSFLRRRHPPSRGVAKEWHDTFDAPAGSAGGPNISPGAPEPQNPAPKNPTPETQPISSRQRQSSLPVPAAIRLWP